ncbi:hypothetical protein BBJ28_00004463 [Nothophytophthora sp. Chile5]|nr:hypothetical protein BBJ28_00004463 [Nothophytophthora sp. Chile5]
MDAQRALLDTLMGRNRDGDRPEEDISDFRHPRVCKPWLCGLCPHDLFQNTKMNLGVCESLHLPEMRAAYERHVSATGSDLGYEQQLVRELTVLVADVEKKIARGQKRLDEVVMEDEEEQEGEDDALLDAADAKRVLELTAGIQEAMGQVKEAGNEGEVERSIELMQKIEELKRVKAELLGPGDGGAAEKKTCVGTGMKRERSKLLVDNPLALTNVNYKLRVCDVCGAFLSIFDSDRRLADHFGGKLHLGYVQIRKKIAEVTERRRERQQAGATDSITKDPKESARKEREESDRREDMVMVSSSRRRGRGRPLASRSRSRPRYVDTLVRS